MEHFSIQERFTADESDRDTLSCSLGEQPVNCGKGRFEGHHRGTASEAPFVCVAIGAGQVAGLCDVERDRIGWRKRNWSSWVAISLPKPERIYQFLLRRRIILHRSESVRLQTKQQ